MSRQRTKERPGVILYFDLLPVLQRMTKEEAADLIITMLEYGKTGAIPDLSTKGERFLIVWEMVKPRIDSDLENWKEKILQSKYAGYCSAEKRQGREPIDFDSWLDYKDLLSERNNPEV